MLVCLLAWLAAIAAFLGTQVVASMLETMAGLPITFSVHTGGVPLDERGAGLTAFGWGVNILSVLAAIAAWHGVRQRTMPAGGRALFFGFLFGSAVLIVCGVPLWKAFANAQEQVTLLCKILEIGLVAVACFAGVTLTRRLKLA